MAISDKLRQLNPNYKKQQELTQKAAARQQQITGLQNKNKSNKKRALIATSGALALGGAGNYLKTVAALAPETLATNPAFNPTKISQGVKGLNATGNLAKIAGWGGLAYGAKKAYDWHKSSKKLKETRGFSSNYSYLSDF